MPQVVGTVTSELNLDTRKALQQYNRFQRTVSQNSKKDNLFSSISADARDFDNSLGKATNRVVAFGAAAAIFTTLAKATSAFAESIVEVDKALTGINVNLGQSAEGLKKFGSTLFNVARQTGQTFDVAAKAAEELARQGLSAEETTRRLKDALTLSRIAGIDSAEAVDTLTAAINSFNKEALTSTEIINKFAAVDTKFAVSSKDLAAAVSRVGSTAQGAGVGLNELIGLVTSLQQTTARGGATIGNGLKTIFTRIQAAPETINALQSVGVAIKNTDGSLRDAVSILKDYAAAREKVGEVERQSLDRTVAGTFQINTLKALLADLSKEYGVYGNAVKTASGATDEAIRKNEQYNQTISSLLNSTGLSIKQLFSNIGSEKLSGVFKEFLGNIENLRSYLSGDSGDDIGESLGNGIIKGLSNVLSGPGLTALFLILAKAFGKVLSTIAEEARTLLTINGAVQARANIQKQINGLLQQATAEELSQYRAASSVLEKKEQILAIQARINQEELIGNPLARSFQVPGRLGLGTRANRNIARGNGYLGPPVFADPIASAVAREQKASGLSASQIYVDRDARVASFANPAGLLIANKRDEPLGGYQGVNRVLSQGGNPKTNGIPGFAVGPRDPNVGSRNAAAEEVYSLFQALRKAKPLGEDFHKIGSQIQDASQKLNKAARENVLGKLAKEFNNAFFSSKIVSNQSQYSAYIPPVSGSIDMSRSVMDRNAARSRQSRGSSGQMLGPSYPFNPALQASMGARAQAYAFANAGIEPGSDFDSPIGPLTRQAMIARGVNRGAIARRRRLADAEKLRGRRNNQSLGAAFILPFAAGFLPEGQGGTLSGQGYGAARGAAQGAGIGGIFGPEGLLAGAVIGAFIGALGKATKSIEEYSAETERTVAARGIERDALVKYVSIQEDLNEAIKNGASSDTVGRLRTSLSAAASGITSTKGASILAENDPAKRSALLAANDQDINRQNVRDAITLAIRSGKTPGPQQFQSNITPEFASSLSLEQKKALGRAANGTFTVTPSEDDAGVVSGAKAFDDFKASLKEVGPILSDFVDVSSITPENLNAIAKSFGGALVRFKSIQDILGKGVKPAVGRLALNAFTSSPNLDAYGQAALTGRNPRASQGQRAQSQYDAFQELLSSGAVGKDTLESDSDFKQARAGVQKNNVLSIAARFLQSNNPNIGRLTNGLGDYNSQSIERQLEFVANGGTRNSGQAKRYLEYVRQAGKTAGDAGLKDSSYGPNFGPEQSGLAPGGKYDAYNQSLKKTEEFATKTLAAANSIVVKTVLAVDGTVKVISESMSSEQLEALATKLTAQVGQTFQAQINDINIRLSKSEGKPLPPTTTTLKNPFPAKPELNANGFYQKAP